MPALPHGRPYIVISSIGTGLKNFERRELGG